MFELSNFLKALGSLDSIEILKVSAIGALLVGVVFLLSWLYRLGRFRDRAQQKFEEDLRLFPNNVDVGRFEAILKLRLQNRAISSLPFAVAPLTVGLALSIMLAIIDQRIIDQRTPQYNLPPDIGRTAEGLSARVDTLAKSVDQLAGALPKTPSSGGLTQLDASSLTASVNGLAQAVNEFKQNMPSIVIPPIPAVETFSGYTFDFWFSFLFLIVLSIYATFVLCLFVARLTQEFKRDSE